MAKVEKERCAGMADALQGFATLKGADRRAIIAVTLMSGWHNP
jgi:hypothetical protein